jgi:hypothetical protein
LRDEFLEPQLNGSDPLLQLGQLGRDERIAAALKSFTPSEPTSPFMPDTMPRQAIQKIRVS